MKNINMNIETTLQKIVGGGQAMGEMVDGRKIFVWGGLPGERVEVRVTKKRSKLADGTVTRILDNISSDRVEPQDPNSYLSTSPWQIMSHEAETRYKKELLQQAFELNNVALPEDIKLSPVDKYYGYRNKIEFSWWWDNEKDQLDLAFFRRGSHTKVPVDGTSLARPEINQVAIKIRDLLRDKSVEAFSLKTLIVRCNQAGNVIAQLYIKTKTFVELSDDELRSTGVSGIEVIFSNPKSPASVITERLFSWGNNILDDQILGKTFYYTAESFFQINLPIYEQALQDIKSFIPDNKPVVDLYSGVGTIGLTVGNKNKTTLIESNESAVEEMKRNISSLGINAKAILSASEQATDYITQDSLIIVDPPRAGLHDNVIKKLLEEAPSHIVYLSCNPTTQSRDIAKLLSKYKIIHQCGYNFFPRTPHIENLIVLQSV